MHRFARILFGVVCLFSVATVVSAGPADDDTCLRNALAVQQAISQARHCLLQSDPGKAVEILEEQLLLEFEEKLPRINGNNTFLRTLREAYRAYIQELWNANDTQQATRYLKKLCVIDASAARDSTLSGPLNNPLAVAAVPRPADARMAPMEPAPAPVQMPPPPIVNPGAATMAAVATPACTISPFAPAGEASKWKPVGTPSLTEPALPSSTAPAASPGPATATPKPALAPSAVPAAVPPVFRGKLNDPFDMSLQRFGSAELSLAQRLQTQGEAEYAGKRFDEARKCFEQAYQADPQSIGDGVRERWAFCILHYVGTRLNKSSVMTAERLEELRKLVQSATTMSAAASDSSQKLLKDIDTRATGLAGGSGSDSVEVQHKGKDAQGWQRAETAHFRVLHRDQDREFIEKVARVAEKTRGEMFRKWFGHDGNRWEEKCDLFVHATAAAYSKATGAPLESPGHSSIDWSQNRGAVVSRRIDIHREQNGLLETLLPRETTHVVLAGMIGGGPLPRWADVGMAVLAESSARVGEHRRNLARCQGDGSLFSVRELLQLADYPSRQRIAAFYAQSVVLVEFLASQRSPTVFTEFLRDARREGNELALRRHYGWNFSDLESHWTKHVLSEAARLARQ